MDTYQVEQRLEGVYCKDLEEEVLRQISKFADDTKIASRVNILNDIRSMQRTLYKLVVWASRW